MVTEGENTTPSSSGATAALSQSRPIMPESFAALDSEEWDSRLAHFEDCPEINGGIQLGELSFLRSVCGEQVCSSCRVFQRPCVRITTISKLLFGQNLSHKKESNFTRPSFEHGIEKKTSTSRIGRILYGGWPEKRIPRQLKRIVLRRSNSSMRWKTGRYGRLKLRESGAKTLDEAVSRELQIEAMCEAESRLGKGRSVRLIQEPPLEEKNELLELIKQNTAVMNQMVAVV